jgi:hypothetical protein
MEKNILVLYIAGKFSKKSGKKFFYLEKISYISYMKKILRLYYFIKAIIDIPILFLEDLYYSFNPNYETYFKWFRRNGNRR